MTHTLNVHNIKCGGCVASIKDRLLKTAGVDSVEADPATGEIRLELSDDSLLDGVKTQLAKMGYPEDDPTMVQTAKSYVSCMIGRVK